MEPFQVGFPVPRVLQQDQQEYKFTSRPLQPLSCVAEIFKVWTVSCSCCSKLRGFRNSHQRRISCAFRNAILSEGTKLFEIPARTTIRSPNHYPLEDSFHELLPTAKRRITEKVLVLLLETETKLRLAPMAFSSFSKLIQRTIHVLSQSHVTCTDWQLVTLDMKPSIFS